MRRIRMIALFIFLSTIADAAIPPRPTITGDQRRGRYVQNGILIGGLQGRETSLLSLQVKPARHRRLERVVLKIGEAEGQPLNGPLPFYQVSILENPPRVVVDVAQMQRTRLEVEDVAQRVRGSQLIGSVDFTMDPEDVSTNLTFHLKKRVRVEVFRQPEAGELVLDLSDEKVNHL